MNLGGFVYSMPVSSKEEAKAKLMVAVGSRDTSTVGSVSVIADMLLFNSEVQVFSLLILTVEKDVSGVISANFNKF